MTFCFLSLSDLQQQQRPDLARLMQMQVQAQLPPGAPSGLPPGLLGAAAAAAGGHPGGVPTSLSLLAAGIPTSLAQAAAGGSPAGLPHPAFASLLGKQPGGAEAALLAAKAREEAEAAAKKAETNGIGENDASSSAKKNF